MSRPIYAILEASLYLTGSTEPSSRRVRTRRREEKTVKRDPLSLDQQSEVKWLTEATYLKCHLSFVQDSEEARLQKVSNYLVIALDTSPIEEENPKRKGMRNGTTSE